MTSFDRVARTLVPSVPVLSRRPALMAVMDAVDRAVSVPFREFRNLPPNRMRIRVGVGNRLFFNQAAFLEYGALAVSSRLSDGTLRMDSRVIDIGSGCGRLAHALRRYRFHGTYDGVDVDSEMVKWCRTNFPSNYRFHFADIYSEVYNPTGSRLIFTLPVGAASQDYVLGQSLFTHLLEKDLTHYLHEAHRVLDRGGHLDMSVFCLEDMAEHGYLGGRWKFDHQVGAARVESLKYPEAAVAYSREFFLKAGRNVGFADVWVAPQPFGQSRLLCRK